MSTSDKITNIKVTVLYLVVTFVCALTAAIYTSFAHGESSPYMTLLFMYPLLAGIIVCTLRFFGFKDRFFVNMFNSAAATFGAWSCISGIFDMATGASSPYMPVFIFIGSAFLAAAMLRAAFLLVRRISSKA